MVHRPQFAECLCRVVLTVNWHASAWHTLCIHREWMSKNLLYSRRLLITDDVIMYGPMFDRILMQKLQKLQSLANSITPSSSPPAATCLVVCWQSYLPIFYYFRMPCDCVCYGIISESGCYLVQFLAVFVHRPLSRYLDVGLLVVMIWLELCTTYSSSSPVVATTSIILCFNKHRLTQVHLESGH